MTTYDKGFADLDIKLPLTPSKLCTTCKCDCQREFLHQAPAHTILAAMVRAMDTIRVRIMIMIMITFTVHESSLLYG